MRRLVLQSLILGEFVLEVHRQVVQLALLVEDHLQVQLINALLLHHAVICRVTTANLEQINHLLFVDLRGVDRDCCEVIDALHFTLGIEEFNRGKFRLLVNLIDLAQEITIILQHLARYFRAFCMRQTAFENGDSDGRVGTQEARGGVRNRSVQA